MQLKLRTYEPHPAGTFDGVITRIVEDSHETYGPQIKVGVETSEQELCVICSQSYSSRSKLGKLTQAALGSLPETLDPEALVGAKLRVLVAHEVKDDGNVYDRVTGFLPATAPGRKVSKSDPFA